MECLEKKGIDLMKVKGSPTKYPGVHRIANKTYRIRGRVTDPRTGKPKELDRILQNVTEMQAATQRAEALEALRLTCEPPSLQRKRVGEYAQSWMKSKVLKIDSVTADKYAECLEKHILPTLGDFYYDMLTKRIVQEWVDRHLREGFETCAKDPRKRKHKPYRVGTVRAWFRVLRNMTQDAVDELGLERNPTLRIEFPEADDAQEPKSLTEEELARFLEVMQERYPQHFALTVLLVCTGLRFCHASAIKWVDWDEEVDVIQLVRKQVKGVVGPLTRKKKAPTFIPVDPELAEILRDHRETLIRNQNPGLREGWMFPSPKGRLRAHHSPLEGIWKKCAAAAGIHRRFTIHGTRYTFTDLSRKAKVDVVTRRDLVGHMTERMQKHYSHVDVAEKRTAIAAVLKLVTLPRGGDKGGDKRLAGREPAPMM